MDAPCILYAPAAPRLAVSLALADFAVLKAAPDFPAHQPMVRLGGDLPDANWWTGEAFVLPGYGHAERIYVPWRSMGHASTPARVGFTISPQDDDNGGERDHTLYWRGNPAKPHLDERAFGVLEFVRDRD